MRKFRKPSLKLLSSREDQLLYNDITDTCWSYTDSPNYSFFSDFFDLTVFQEVAGVLLSR